MSSLWTPEGEYPVGDKGDPRPKAAPPSGPGPAAEPDADEAAIRAQLEEARSRVAEVPAEVIVINHAMGLYELAAIHLSASPPDLVAAALAIDAFGCLVEGLGDRLGPEAATLRDALAQVRLAFVQIKGTLEGSPDAAQGG